MRIAVIGAGVSGLVAARLLATRHDVQIFESANYLGGHANTVEVDVDGQNLAVDTGFMVYNEQTYPQFTRLLKFLEIETQPTDMSLSVSCERTGLEYQGSSLAGLFAQRRNLIRPRFYRMLADIVRFNRRAKRFLLTEDTRPTLREFLIAGNYGPALSEHYLLPMTAAIWSCPPDNVLDYPVRFLLEFMDNHGLLQIRDRPRWRTIVGGSRRYVQAIADALGSRIHLNTPIKCIVRYADHIVIETRERPPEVFDAVVVATHADTSLKLLEDADRIERTLLAAFAYARNEAVLHTDERWLPQRHAAWASWNYRIATGDTCPVCVTYDLTRLQGIAASRRLLVTLNPAREISTECVLKRLTYHHPVFSRSAIAAQSKWAEISGKRRTYFCGSYWGHGFHEDGVVSALAVANQFGIGLEACTAPCIVEASRTAVPAL